MKGPAAILILIVVGAALLIIGNSAYIVNETEQVIKTQFGEPVGEPVTTPGINFKLPFIQKVTRFEKRFLEWDGDPNQLPTKDKRFIRVDTYARWQIIDPLQFFIRLKNEPRALTQLNDILDGETRNTIARHDLIEVVRDSDREFEVFEELGAEDTGAVTTSIESGRSELEREVLEASSGRVDDLGIRILDFRFKRINYVEEVQREVYARMISERQRIAERFRSEGDGEAARINGEKDRELKRIESEAYREAEEIRGKADARAADVYAAAYNRDAEFYRFTKTMEAYEKTLDDKTLLLLTTDGEFLRYLEKAK